MTIFFNLALYHTCSNPDNRYTKQTHIMSNKATLKSHRRVIARLVAAAFLTALLHASAAAWGGEGHHIVTMIAEKHLSATARQQINDILTNNHLCGGGATVLNKMLCASTWPDDSRNTTHPQTYNWHFVDISLRNKGYDPLRDCEPEDQDVKGKCGIYGLDHALKILRKEITDPKISRAQALMFVIHIVGDLHQPLHTVKEKTGGNFYFVQYFEVPSQLHKVWDSKIIGTRMLKLGKSESQYAAMLDGGIASAGGLASLQQGDAVGWLNEAHAEAIGDAYECPSASDCNGPSKWLRNEPFKSGSHTTRQLENDYFNHNLTIIERQLQRGGARLAKVLSDALG
ncbi:MAG: S1/P1 nuclease [Pyrinomonadaceae bacterium]